MNHFHRSETIFQFIRPSELITEITTTKQVSDNTVSELSISFEHHSIPRFNMHSSFQTSALIQSQQPTEPIIGSPTLTTEHWNNTAFVNSMKTHDISRMKTLSNTMTQQTPYETFNY